MKHSVRILFISVLTVLTFVSRSFASDQIKEGKDALNRGDYIKAIEAFREATQKDKKNPEAFLLLGTAYLKADSADQAVGALVQARELSPNDAQIYLLLGDVYAQQHFIAPALEQYKKAAELDSVKPDIFLKIAEYSWKARSYNETRNAYMKVLQLDSTNAVALTHLGSIYVRAKPPQWQNALPIYIRLSKMYPDSLSILSIYVRVLAENEFWKDLVPVAKKVLDRNPDNDEINAIYGEALVKTGQSEEAIKQLEKLNPDSMKTEDLISLAKAYKGTEKYDKAIAIYQRVLKRDSTRCDIPYDLGTTYMKVKDYSSAVTMFEKKIACDTAGGYQFASHLNAAMSLMQLKNFKDAKTHALKSVEYKPDHVQAWQIVAQIYGQLDQTDDEITAYKKVIDLALAASENGDAGKYNAQLLEAYRMIGVRHLIDATKTKEPDAAKKKYVASLEYLKKALALNPKDCSLLLWTAQSYQNSNNKEEAKKYYCRVLENCPKSKEAKDAQTGLTSLGMTCGQ
ncbi:MAG: tetratricopeptide repeat protein [Ignavibacteriae bacterium]|nr:tetratricopeptide repeat protein [Ignavibacteriota bacterium]